MQLCRNIENETDMAEASAERRDYLVDRAINDLFGDHTLLLEGEDDEDEDEDEDDEDLEDEDDLDED